MRSYRFWVAEFVVGLEIGDGGIRVGDVERVSKVTSFDSGERGHKHLGTVRKCERKRTRSFRQETVQLCHVPYSVRGCDENSSWLQHPADLSDRRRRVRHVVEHVVGDDQIEGLIVEPGFSSRRDRPGDRQALSGKSPCFDHSRRLVRRLDGDGRYPVTVACPQVAHSSPDLKHPRAISERNLVEHPLMPRHISSAEIKVQLSTSV